MANRPQSIMVSLNKKLQDKPWLFCEGVMWIQILTFLVLAVCAYFENMLTHLNVTYNQCISITNVF